MKAKLLVVIVSILISNFAIANGYYDLKGERTRPVVREQSYQAPTYVKTCSQSSGCGESTVNNCERSNGCGGFSSVTCSCADPGCFYGNPCMSSGKCCESFGNIGSGDFEPLCSCAN